MTTLWYVARGTGTVALVMLTLAVLLGVLNRSGRRFPGLPRFAVADLHRTASLTAVVLGGVHLVSLWLDPYAALRVVNLVVPFTSSYRPLYVGLGTLAVDLLAVVTITSLLRFRLGQRAFRTVHWAVYGLWAMAVGHGLGAGTDGGTQWFRWLTVGCVAAVAVAVTWRVRPRVQQRHQERVPRVVAR